jgi:predicted metal-dependent phosphoesterase TrpH
MKFDMHCHSSYSPDGHVDVKDILLNAKKNGFNGVAITDHNEIKGSLKAYEMADDIGVAVVRGMEVSSEDGHILAYGISDPVARDLSASETVDKIKKLGGTAVAAHPFRWYTGLNKRTILKNDFTGFEAFNSRSLTSTNKKVERLASKHGKAVTGGSDCHRLDEFGGAFTIYEENLETEDDFLEAIAKRNTKVGGNGRPMSASIKYASLCLKEWFGRGMRKI